MTLIKPEYGQWIWRHEPEQYVHDNYSKALDHVQNGTPFQNTNIPPGYVHESWGVDELMAKIKEGDILEFAGDWA
jgi:hypothetical protein